MRKFAFARLVATFAVLALSSLAPAAEKEPEVRVVRTFSGWREAASFKRISEYFSGKENTGGEIILRTHPEQRGGYYLLVRVVNDGQPVAARIVVHIVTPDNAAPRTFTFNSPLAGGTSVFDLGLTGADWPDPKINAVAWRLDIQDDSGRRLATGKSYLWDKPVGP